MRRNVASGGNDLAVALLAVGFFVWLAFQTVQLVRDSQALDSINRSQDAPLQDASRLRQAADSLAGETAQLAQDGNAGAKAVVDEMAKQGVVLRPQPNAAPAGTPAAPAQK